MRFPKKESSILEFKQAFPKKDQIIKTVIGFCNQQGGRLIVGIEDDGTIIGISENEAQEAMEWLEQSIYKACTPPILPFVYLQRIEDKTLVIIEVSSGMNKPYFQTVSGMEKGTYIRLGRSTVRATTDIIEELRWQSRGLNYDQSPVYASDMQSIDKAQLTTFLENRKQGWMGELDEAVYQSYNLISKEYAQTYASVSGVLLFCKTPQDYLPESYIICTHFSGVSGREAIARKDCTGTLINQLDMAYAFVISRLNSKYQIQGKQRNEKLEIPPIAIREMLINAIVHRNYHIKAPIKIAIYNDRIEIFSPGGFPGPIDVNNLRSGITYIRNPTICKVMREAGYVEKLGSGFITLLESYEAENLKRPEVIEGENYVKVILPRVSLVDDQLEKDEQILALFDHFETLTMTHIVSQLSISRSSVGRLLSKLLEEKKIIKQGEGRATLYKKGTG